MLPLFYRESIKRSVPTGKRRQHLNGVDAWRKKGKKEETADRRTTLEESENK